MSEKREWTTSQQDAIDARDGTVLVSAAAGSGKTAVLIERIIKRITDTNNPCDINKLLIVTFTRAATAEMRTRLFTAVSDAMKELIDNKDENDASFKDKLDHLKRQQMLIPSANIFTIDAFCTNLVRENFEALHVSPDFSMIDEIEGQALQEKAISEILENYYQKDDKVFKDLVELFSTNRDDDKLSEIILNIYKFSKAFANPKKILENSISEYNDKFTYKTSTFFHVVWTSVLGSLKFEIENLDYALSEIFANEPLASTIRKVGIANNDLSFAISLFEEIKDFEIDKAVNLCQTYEFKSFSGKSGDVANACPYFPAVTETRKSLKAFIESIPSLFCETEAEVKDDINFIAPVLQKLIDITFEFGEKYDELKTEKNALDFSDVEQYALELLVDVEKTTKDELVRKELAETLSKQYVEILIDEYQDTNDLQDTIFRALSNNENNMFMVGDVKQSIYGFRNAMPNIFNDKKSKFQPFDRVKKNYPASINLGENFRSREGVLEYINFVFKQIMSKDLGEIEYNDTEKLNYGAKKAYDDKPLPESETEVEFHLFNIDKDVDNIEQEANFVADYIISKVTSGVAKYSDFAILMQYPKAKSPKVEKILKDRAIPVYSETGSSFLETADVMIITSFIKAINNPLLDIPLLATLMSPIFGFTTDDMARIKCDNYGKNIYSLVKSAADKGDAKSKYFLSELEKYRRLSVSLPAGELVRKIYEDTCFPQLAGAMPNGAQRIANLMLFQEYADAFDQTKSFGVAGFVRYIESLEENDGELETASLSSGNDNVVKIMSIHKSKGLEFKYCILMDTKHKFNDADLSKTLIFDNELGLGIKGRDLETGHTYPTIMYQAVRISKTTKLYSEYERVLYVALTRAREKLIILGSINNEQSSSSYMDKYATDSKDFPIHPIKVLRPYTFIDWLLMATIRHPNAGELRALTNKSCATIACDFNITCKVHSAQESFDESKIPDRPKDIDKAKVDELNKRIDFEYKYLPLSKVSTKRAASKMQDEEFNENYFATAKPAFLAKDNFTPAQRGTCLHKFMQYANFEVAKTNVEAEISRLKDEQFLTAEETEVLNIEKIKGFFKSDISKRIFNSPNVEREKKFSILVPATKYDDTLPKEFENEKVLIQGIADCIFEENGSLIILDYKTDRDTVEQVLIDRHKPQLETYVDAIQQITGKPVSAAYIYSFSMDKEIKVI